MTLQFRGWTISGPITWGWVGPVNRDEFFVAITWKILSRARFKIQAGKKCAIMASANVSKLFHQFGLAATLLLQLHGLLYVYITYRHHVNKKNKCLLRCKANHRSKVQRNDMRIYIPLNRVVPVCKAGWPGCPVIKMLKKHICNIYRTGKRSLPLYQTISSYIKI